MKIFFLQNYNLQFVEDGQYLVENMTVFFQAKVFVFPHNTCLPLFCHVDKNMVYICVLYNFRFTRTHNLYHW